MDYSVKIDSFEGPLDLLLHLIKKSNIDIYDISIDEITKSYLEYINKMEELNIDVASSYLVMAAELMEIKSKSLLPKVEEEEEDEEEVSRENLINKLFDDIFNRGYVAVTFLSILEMSKEKELKIRQDKNFGNIYLEMR